MKMLWCHRDIAAPAAVVWELLSRPEHWPDWGPTVTDADVVGERLEAGASGTVRTVFGIPLRFTITSYEPGVSWAWKVAGVEATDHRVEPLGPERCRVSIGVPWPAAPYLVVCQAGVRRLDTMAHSSGVSS